MSIKHLTIAMVGTAFALGAFATTPVQAQTIDIRTTPSGQIIQVRDINGRVHRPSDRVPNGPPPNNPVISTSEIVIIHTQNPTCWIPTAGGWYKVPC